jgi:hypothetical protein
MGIIMSALAAAGDAGVHSVDQNIKQSMQMEQDDRRSQLETQKAKALIDYQKQAQMEMDNQKRQGIADRIGAAKGGIIQGQIADKYAASDAAVAAADAGQTDSKLTPEQSAVIAQSKGIDTEQTAKDPHTYIKAAMASGDIDPKEVAALVQQEDSLRRQEASQAAQFAHSDKSQREQFAHSDASQSRAQSFQAGENKKTRDAVKERNLPPAGITDSEKQNWIHTYIAGNGSVPRSAPAYVRNSIGTWAAQMGVTPDSIAKGTAQAKFDQSAAVTAGHRSGVMAGVEAAIPDLVENAVATSAKVDKGNFVPLNKLMMMGEDSISDPNLAAFRVAHQALASEYQQVIGRGGANVFALKEALHVLEGAKSQEAYIAAAEQVRKEVDINVAAMAKVRANAGGVHVAPPPGPASVIQNPISQTPALPDGWTVKVH